MSPARCFPDLKIVSEKDGIVSHSRASFVTVHTLAENLAGGHGQAAI